MPTPLLVKAVTLKNVARFWAHALKCEFKQPPLITYTSEVWETALFAWNPAFPVSRSSRRQSHKSIWYMDDLFRAKPWTLSLKTHFEFVCDFQTLPFQVSKIYCIEKNKSNSSQQINKQRNKVACYARKYLLFNVS